MIMNPPPPMFPALGCVTARANAVATAASTAFPPLARIAAPTSEAGADTDTTSPVFDSTAAESRWARSVETGTRRLAMERARDRIVVMRGWVGALGGNGRCIRYASGGRPAAHRWAYLRHETPEFCGRTVGRRRWPRRSASARCYERGRCPRNLGWDRLQADARPCPDRGWAGAAKDDVPSARPDVEGNGDAPHRAEGQLLQVVRRHRGYEERLVGRYRRRHRHVFRLCE